MNEQDDQYIIDQIRALPPEVTEIVLVSSDQGYVECLRERAATGVKVFWAATRNVYPNQERRALSEDLEPLFNSIFTFIELADFKDEIMRTPWVEKAHVERIASASVATAEKPTAFPRVLIEIEGDRNQMFAIHSAVWQALAPFAAYLRKVTVEFPERT